MLVNNATDVENVLNAGIYGLGTDINLGTVSNFTELGMSPGFDVIFDGFDHTLSNLTISNNDNPLGLFASVNAGGIVRNLNLSTASLTDTGGDPAALGMVAGVNSGIVANITAAGTLLNLDKPLLMGGIVGDNTSTGIIYVANSSVNISTTGSGVPQDDSAVGAWRAIQPARLSTPLRAGQLTAHKEPGSADWSGSTKALSQTAARAGRFPAPAAQPRSAD